MGLFGIPLIESTKQPAQRDHGSPTGKGIAGPLCWLAQSDHGSMVDGPMSRTASGEGVLVLVICAATLPGR
jgi:hypothetical protein